MNGKNTHHIPPVRCMIRQMQRSGETRKFDVKPELTPEEIFQEEVRIQYKKFLIRKKFEAGIEIYKQKKLQKVS